MTKHYKEHKPRQLSKPDTVFTIEEPAELLTFLLDRLPQGRNVIKSILSHRQIMVDGVVVTQFNYELKPGQEVRIRWDIIRAGDKVQQIKIVYEDSWIIVIDKPAGLLTIASDKEKEITAYRMVTEMVKRKDEQARIFIVHRLDQETSGLMLFAKDETTKRALQDHWKECMVDRAYLAVVEGRVSSLTGTIRSWLKETKTRLVYSSSRSEDGLEAVTQYQVVKTGPHYSLLELRLLTGRKNQIRVHLKDMGHSIVGDKKYGASSNPIKRMALHAHVLSFRHPHTQEVMRFETEAPKKFITLLHQSAR